MRIVPNSRPVVPADPVVIATPHVELSTSAPGHVKTGTPLKPVGDGWTRAEHDEDEPENRLYALTAGWAGEKVAVASEVTLRVDLVGLTPGGHLKIIGVDEVGNLQLAHADDGLHIVLTKDTIQLR